MDGNDSRRMPFGEADIVKLLFHTARMKITTVTPNNGSCKTTYCTLDNMEEVLTQLFPFNALYYEHVFFISFKDTYSGKDSLEQGTPRGFWFGSLLQELWKKSLALQGQDYTSARFVFFTNYKDDNNAAHDLRFTNVPDLCNFLLAVGGQYSPELVGSDSDRILGCLYYINMAINKTGCSFGINTKGKNNPPLDVAFAFLVSDSLLQDIRKDYPFNPASSSMVRFEIEKMPEFKDNLQQETTIDESKIISNLNSHSDDHTIDKDDKNKYNTNNKRIVNNEDKYYYSNDRDLDDHQRER